MARRLELKGQRFGRLVALVQSGINKRGDRMWQCRCDCGSLKEASGARLKAGHIRSCGCLAKEAARNKIPPSEQSVRIARMSAGGMAPRDIVKAMGVSRGTVSGAIDRARKTGAIA